MRRLLLASLAFAACAAEPPAQQLRALFDRETKAAADASPTCSTEALRAAETSDRDSLTSLRRIPRSALALDDRTRYDLLEREFTRRIEQFRLRLYLTPWFEDPRFAGPGLAVSNWLISGIGDSYSTEAEAERAVRKLAAAPAALEGATALLRQGLESGILPPRIVVRSYLPMLAAFAQVRCCAPGDGPRFTPAPLPLARNSPLYRRFRSLDALPAEARDRVQGEAAAAIEKLLPAARALWTFVAGEYLQACPESESLSGMKTGAAIYRELARQSTGTEIEPDRLHELGLAEVARIRGELSALAAKLGNRDSLDSFLSSVYRDRSRRFSTEQELLDAYRGALARIQPQLGRVVGRQPTVELRIEPVRHGGAAAMYSAPHAGAPYGAIRVEVSRLDLHPKFEVLTLALHEGVPGHHLEITLRRRVEGEGRAMYRSSFGEGWALYCESLGEALGLYEDPYDRLGWLGMDLMRAVRVVTDTGIHARGWSFEQARRYFAEQTGKGAAMAEIEVIRSTWPAGVLAYKVGEWRIRAMRERAAKVLGARFRPAAFHDALISWSPLPIDIMERRLDECLADRACAAQLR